MTENKKSLNDILELFAKCNPRTRKTTVRYLGDKVSKDNYAYEQEELSFIEPDATVRSINIIATKSCDFNHVLDQHVRIISTCSVCGAHLCSTPGCSLTCAGLRCGRVICRRCAHTSFFNDEIFYCPRCRLPAFLKWLFIGERR